MMARELDVKVTRITKATVYYELTVGGRQEQWRVPNASTFDLSQLKTDTRYRVWTKVIWSDEYDFRAGHKKRVERYDWVSVQEVHSCARSTTLSAKQSASKKALLEKPLADDGKLFRWGTK
jgi:hypothetical protein